MINNTEYFYAKYDPIAFAGLSISSSKDRGFLYKMKFNQQGFRRSVINLNNTEVEYAKCYDFSVSNRALQGRMYTLFNAEDLSLVKYNTGYTFETYEPHNVFRGHVTSTTMYLSPSPYYLNDMNRGWKPFIRYGASLLVSLIDPQYYVKKSALLETKKSKFVKMKHHVLTLNDIIGLPLILYDEQTEEPKRFCLYIHILIRYTKVYLFYPYNCMCKYIAPYIGTGQNLSLNRAINYVVSISQPREFSSPLQWTVSSR